jgi:NADH-quinone oxidoreductase subunit E
MVQINHDYYEDLDAASFGKLLDDLAAGRPVKTGSQTGRTFSEPFGGGTTLTDATLYDGSRIGAWKARFDEAAKEAPGKDAPAKPSGESGGPAVPGSGNTVHVPQPAAPKGLGVAPAGSPAGNAVPGDEPGDKGVSGQGSADVTSKKPGGNSPGKR